METIADGTTPTSFLRVGDNQFVLFQDAMQVGWRRELDNGVQFLGGPVVTELGDGDVHYLRRRQR